MPAADTVLFVSTWPYLGGAQVSLATVLASPAAGIRHVLAVPGTGPFVDRVRALPDPPELLVLPELGSAPSWRVRTRAAWVLGRWIVRNRARVQAVHCNGDSELKLLLPVLPLLVLSTRAPVAVWHHNKEVPASLARLRQAWRLFARRIVWMPVSAAARDELRAVGIGNDRDTVVVPNPIDAGAVVPEVRAARTGDTFVAGYLGFENVDKGILELPAIAERLRGSRVRILCVTKERAADALAPEVNDALAQLRALPELVEFTPRDHDVRNVYARVDALLVPSHAESFCRIAAEAMCNGLPVVGSDLPALREVLGDDAGLLFPVRDTDAASAALLRLADDAGLVAGMGAAGRERADRYSPAAVAELLGAVYALRPPVDARQVGRSAT
ncbi:MAG: glycosyltransferase family 4 protein [Acidimicrobiia bacterium]